MPACRSTTTGRGQHVGLQQLASVASVANSLLGPEKRYKFVEDQASGESSLACSPLRLLECLDLSCATGQLLNETVRAHHRAFHTGTGALAFMVKEWSAAALECLHAGIPVSDIVSAMSDGLDSCSRSCRASAVTLQDALLSCTAAHVQARAPSSSSRAPSLSSRPHPGTQVVSCSSRNLLSTCTSCVSTPQQKIKLRHSRYFSPKEEAPGEAEMPPKLPLLHPGRFGCHDIACLTSALSHGCSDGMRLVVEASQLQTENSRCPFTFDVTKIVTCLLPGLSEDRSCVTLGLVTFVSAEQAPVMELLRDRSLCLALFNGDLNEKHRHLGFNRPSNVTAVTESLSSSGVSREDRWVRHVSETLLRLSVNLLLVNGVVLHKLKESCRQREILIVERVKHSVLKEMARATGAALVTYPTQISQQCVGRGARVAFWGDSPDVREVGLNLRTAGSTLVTAVIASPVPAKLQALEDRFWGCAYRVHHALEDGQLLPGAGATEMLCVRQLQALCSHGEGGARGTQGRPGAARPHRDAVLQLMAIGWMEYVAALMSSTGVYSSRWEAWAALHRALKNPGSAAPRPWSKISGPDADPGANPGEAAGQAVVYDNMTVKLEVWRRALDVVLLVLQTDTEIVTGSSIAEELSDHLILL